MTRPAAIRQADVSRIVRGAIKGGMPAGSFTVEVVDGVVRLLPVLGVAPLPSESAASSAQEALKRWRRSA